MEGKKSLPVILYCNRDAASRRRMVERLAACSAAGARAAAVEETIALLDRAGTIEQARSEARTRYRQIMRGLEREAKIAGGESWTALRAVTDALIG